MNIDMDNKDKEKKRNTSPTSSPHKSKFEPLLLCIANNAEGFPELKK